jgi:DNA-binding SARP family transcriptional activator
MMNRRVHGSTKRGAALELRGEEPPSLDLRPSFWVAGVFWVASASLAIWAAPIEPSILAWLSFAAVGVLLVWLKARHPVGWLLLTDGLVWTGGAAAHRFVTLPSSTGLSEAMVASAFDLVGWIVAIGLIPLTLLLVPIGRFMGRWDRLAALSIVVGGGCLAIVGLTTATILPSYPSLGNPFEMSDLPDWVDSLRQPAEQVFLLGVIGALMVLIVRFIRSTRVLRQQLRWLAFAGAMVFVGFMVGDLLAAFGLPGAPWANTLPMLTVPVAIGVAVLRHRLWDLDLLVRGTIIYGLVALGVTVVYVVLVAGVGTMAERGGAETWLAILATAIAATLFQPIRHGATTAVNRVLTSRRPAAPEVMVWTLGGFRVERHGVPVPRSEWHSRKSRQLLKMLAASRGRPLHREQAIEVLWPDADTPNLSNRLAVALSTLRSVLDPEKNHEPGHYVESGDDILRLRLEHVTVDLELFMDHAASATTTGEMYRGDFFVEDLYEDWARPTREEARAVYLALLRRRAKISQDLHPAEALEARLRILEMDPWDETTHLDLIQGLRTAGRHGEARRAQKRYEEIMAEIGVSPVSD